MSDNWTPPPGRNPNEPDAEGEQPTEPAKGPARRDGQSPLWWTESTEKQKEYLQPAPPGEQTPLVGPPGSRQNNLTWNLPPYSQPGATPPRRPTGPGPGGAGQGPGGAGQGPGGPAPRATDPSRRARHAGPPSGGVPADGGLQGFG